MLSDDSLSGSGVYYGSVELIDSKEFLFTSQRILFLNQK